MITRRIFYRIVLLVLLFSNTVSAQQNKDSKKRYIKVPEGYLMVLLQGDNILQELEAFAEAEKIPAANFTGMGFVKTIKFGFFNFETKKYDPKEFTDSELASMNGTIAHQNGKVSIHAHGIVTDKTFAAFGGHILDGKVGTGSVEIMILVHDKPFERIMEKDIGANVLCIDKCN